MDILIGYESALQYWRTVGPQFLHTYDARQSAVRRAHRAIATPSKPQLNDGNRRPAGCSLPVHTLIGGTTCRTSTSSITSHLWHELPEKSFVDAGEGFLVSTPEFCFLQMANQLSLGCLIQLGFELCGTYYLAEGASAQRRDMPLTKVSKLKAFIAATPNTRGHKKAKRALEYMLDGSASPMETVLTMLLCLPYSLGGYGLEAPLLNFHVDVPPSYRKLADRRYCECDLCWPNAKLVVEYDSKLHHSDDDRQESDARRRNTLITLGFTVVTVSKDQVMDSGVFNRLAHQLAKCLRKRLRYKDPQFTHAHCELRDELFEAMGITRRS